MTKQEKTNLKRGLIVLFLSFFFFIPAIILNFIHRVPPLLDRGIPAMTIKTSQEALIESIKMYTLIIKVEIAKVPNMTVPETIIVEPATLGEMRAIRGHELANPRLVYPKKRWICKAPRELIQGSGTVKECEYE